MKNLTLLAIDDDPLILDSLKLMQLDGWKIETFNALPKALLPRFHAALVDLHLDNNPSHLSGLNVIKTLKDKHPHLEIIAISGDIRRELMEKALLAGASRFLAKPLHNEELLSTLSKIAAFWELRTNVSRSKNVHWLGSSAQAEKVRKEISHLKGEPGPILIQGESGTGKEVVSQLINLQEENRPWLSINLASIPENLFESELFGHIKGAFTGAEQNKIGLIEAANGGDLFLDEIEALPLHLQPKLLRFLESGEIRKVGSNQNLYVQTRVLAASNEDLSAKIKAGQFREDLYYRLSGRTITLPPLRTRTTDIEILAKHFLSQNRNRNLTLSEDAVAELKKYPWPGNVRELKRIIEQTSLHCPLPVIRAEDLTHLLYFTETFDQKTDLRIGLPTLLKNYERLVLQEASLKFPDIDTAAKVLGISKSSYYQKLKDFEIGSKS